MQRLTTAGNRKQDNSLISSYGYGYDLPSHKDVRSFMEAQVGTSPLQRTNYTYDDINQLQGEVLNKPATGITLNTAYAYDAMGNRVQQQNSQTQGTTTTSWSTSYTSNKLNQLVSLANTNVDGSSSLSSLSYDTAGNLTSQRRSGAQGGTSYSYDDLNRLTGIVQQDESTGVNQRKSEFVYDASSRKVIGREFTWDTATGAWVQQSEVRRIYSGMDVVQERDGSNQVTVNYTRSGNIGGLLARSTSEGHFYYHYDGSGNVSQLTDAAQATVAEYEYDAYGVLQSASGPQAAQPYRYSTKELHAASGLYDYGYRFYSPSLGRWINRDPIAESGGLNLYAMVGNDPVNLVDDYGLAPGDQDNDGVPDIGDKFDGPGEKDPYPEPPSGPPPLFLPGGGFGGGRGGGGTGHGGPLAPPVQGPPARRVAPPPSSPSTTQPGPHAGGSIPARGPGRDFTDDERGEVDRIGGDTGCHTCGSKDPGTKSGHFIPDHQPPNKICPPGQPQRLYPHCKKCSNRQGGHMSHL